MIHRLALIAMAGVLLLAASVSAFDGDRKGFILGGGAGLGAVSSEGDDTKLAFMTDFVIGYAPTPQLAIHYTNKVAWYSTEWITGSIWDWQTESITTVAGVSAAAVTYWFQPVAPSPFITGGIGIGIQAAPFESNADSYTGLGLVGGAGYEFSRHWSVAAEIVYAKPEERGFSWDVWAFRLMVTGLAY